MFLILSFAIWCTAIKIPVPGVQASYGFFRTLPLPNYVDIGCFIARTSMAKRVGMRDKSFNGDAIYFDDLIMHLQRQMSSRKNRKNIAGS